MAGNLRIGISYSIWLHYPLVLIWQYTISTSLSNFYYWVLTILLFICSLILLFFLVYYNNSFLLCAITFCSIFLLIPHRNFNKRYINKLFIIIIISFRLLWISSTGPENFKVVPPHFKSLNSIASTMTCNKCAHSLQYLCSTQQEKIVPLQKTWRYETKFFICPSWQNTRVGLL